MRTPAIPSIVALAALLAGGCGQKENAIAPEALPAAAVHVAVVRRVNDLRRQEIPGTVRPVDHASIAPKVMGMVESIPVSLGQTVKRGDVLATISAREINARVAQAEAGLDQATRDLERETALLAKKASTAEMVRNLEDRRRGAAALLDEAKTMLGYTTITAPFDGVVTRKLLNEGDLTAPGRAMIEIENPARVRVETEVADSLGGVAVGTSLPIRVGTVELTGTVAEISPSSDSASRTFLVKIDLPRASAVRPGEFARVAWPAGRGDSLLVPEAAVTFAGQLERVFVVSDGHADLRLVKTGARSGGAIEILAGLSEGEKVVIEGAATLREGQPVEISP